MRSGPPWRLLIRGCSEAVLRLSASAALHRVLGALAGRQWSLQAGSLAHYSAQIQPISLTRKPAEIICQLPTPLLICFEPCCGKL